MTPYKFTKQQRETLIALYKRGATTLGTALTAYDGINPQTVSSLLRMGLTDKHVKREGRSSTQVTAYWLTAAGIIRAKGLA